MPITAQSADGNLHEFPDGTPDAVIDKVMKAYAAEKAPKGPNSYVDAARSIPGGLAKGVAAVAGLPGDVQQWITGESRATSLPTSEGIGNAIAAPFGGFYEPQTTAGKYAETIASFAPAAAVPGSIAARVARVAVPGAASEAAGQATEGTWAEPYARVGGALLGGGVMPLARTAGRAAGGFANRASEAAFDVPLRNPTQQAQRALRNSIAREGGPAPITGRLNDWAASGASDPSLIDVSGNATRRLVRSAAGTPEGEAQNIAQSYADRIGANLQDRAVIQTRRLTPNEQRPANVVAEELETTQGNLAQEQYRTPYAQPAEVTREMVSALQGPEGRGAINAAYAAARANRDQQAMAELSDLRKVAARQSGGQNPVTGRVQSLEQALGELSAGSLDRVRIAMRDTGAALAQNPRTRAIARGYRGRTVDIDTALDQTPGLTEARGTYRDYATQREAIDVGRTGLNEPAPTYGAQITDLATRSPQAREMAGVGYRQSIEDAIQRPAEGSTGVLNRLSTSNQQTQNLENTFGPQAAGRFQTAVGNEADRLRNARFISPNTGSQTEPRLAENVMVNLATGTVRAWTHIVDALRSGRVLTAREKAEVVRLATTEADLRRLITSLPQGRNSAQIAQQILINSGLGANNPRQ